MFHLLPLDHDSHNNMPLEIDIKAEAAAARAKPKTYVLPSLSGDISFVAMGCQGSGNEGQRNVAELLEQYALTTHPSFILLLGDNVYDYGVSHASDNMFKTYFDDVYLNHPTLKQIPFFVILGNHDENLHKLGVLEAEHGIARGMHEVAHSYLAENKDVYQSHTDDLIIQLNPEQLPAWNMPSRAYAILCGNTQVFCIDSNTYVKDYLQACKDKKQKGSLPDLSNQTIWLLNAVNEAKLANRKVILALHHPLVTLGKRAFHNDTNIYLTNDDLNDETFKEIFGALFIGKGPSYNQLICETLKQQQLEFDTVLAAHDHDIYYYNNINTDADYKICQIVSGGGGGSLQDRHSFSEQDQLGCFLQHHGFTVVSSPANGPILFDILTIADNRESPAFHLKFNSDNCTATRIYTTPNKDNLSIESICRQVKVAIHSYLYGFIATRQHQDNSNFLGISLFGGNMSHGHEGVKRVHDIWAYISQYRADDYATTIKTIHEMSRWKSTYRNPTANSFITHLDKALSVAYGNNTTMASLYETVQLSESCNWHIC